jgi:hypothetical protein
MKAWTEQKGEERSAEIRDGKRFNRYAGPRRQMEQLWALICGQPVKFPAPPRRRREDREIPKAA